MSSYLIEVLVNQLSFLLVDHIQMNQMRKTMRRENRSYHLCETSSRHNVTRMHKTIEMSSALLDLLTHVIVDFHVKDISHKIKRILVVLDFRVKASQVEAVGQVVFVNFAVILIAARRDELFRDGLAF